MGQALSRLARSGRLMRIRQGVYMRPIESRFGRCAPSTEKSLLALSELWRETIVSNGGGAANWLGLGIIKQGCASMGSTARWDLHGKPREPR